MNDASIRHMLAVQDRPSRPWPLVGTFAIGLVLGALGTYVVTQRSQIRRLGHRALAFRKDLLGDLGRAENEEPVSVTSHRSNHRRKAAAEVT
jgi:hypothetical protein